MTVYKRFLSLATLVAGFISSFVVWQGIEGYGDPGDPFAIFTLIGVPFEYGFFVVFALMFLPFAQAVLVSLYARELRRDMRMTQSQKLLLISIIFSFILAFFGCFLKWQ